MKIRITMDIDSFYADPEHKMGVTEIGYDAIMERLSEIGSDIYVEAALAGDGDVVAVAQ